MDYQYFIQCVIFLFRFPDGEHDTEGSTETLTAQSNPLKAPAVDSLECDESHEGIQFDKKSVFAFD